MQTVIQGSIWILLFADSSGQKPICRAKHGESLVASPYRASHANRPAMVG
jgi:hypothetical protein